MSDVTMSEPTSKWSDVFPQDSAPPAPLQTTTKEPYDAIIYAHTPLIEKTPGGFQPRNASACKIFVGTHEEFAAYEQRLRDEAQAAKDAASQARREAAEKAAALEPQPSPSILQSSENMTFKSDPYAINDIVTAENENWRDLLSDKHFDLSSRDFFEAIGYDDDAQLHFSPGGTRAYWEARGNLDGFAHVDPDPRLVGETPSRRFLVSKFAFPAERGIKITEHLRSYAKSPKLVAIVFDATDGGVECWWDVAALSQKKLASFYRKTLTLGALKQSGRGLHGLYARCACGRAQV